MATGGFTDHLVEEIPEPKIEARRFRRHVCRGAACRKTAQGRGDLYVSGSHVGSRAERLTMQDRAPLGISLGKTTALMAEPFGLRPSTAASGHLRWFARRFDPVVRQWLAFLRESPMVQSDETGGRIHGRNGWR